MAFNLITLELAIFIVVMLVYTRLRKSIVTPLKLVKDLTIYIPPTQADFDFLVKSSAPVRENAKGKKNKYDSKNASKEGKFPMRTMQMGEELL